jgi:tRNA(fMet)-specific endonuclease VapC
MTAFDTDILNELLLRNVVYTQRADLIPEADRVIPVVALEEVLRGRLDGIRRAQAGRVKLTVERAYDLFREAIEDTRPYRILPYTPAAHTLVQRWQKAKIRVGTNDMRIAATCIDHGATLVTRNARDYAQIPGLTFDVWN